MNAQVVEVSEMDKKSRIARKYVNVMDQVEEARTLVPAFTAITKVGKVVSFTREQNRPTSAFWGEYNDLVLGDLVRSGLLGQ